MPSLTDDDDAFDYERALVMPADRFLAMPCLVALLAVAALSCPCGYAANPGPRPQDDLVQETNETIARERAKRQKEWNETLAKLRSMCKDFGVEVKPDEDPDPMGIFGLGKLQERGETAAKAAARIEVTSEDLHALDIYADGDFQTVEEMLSGADDVSEKRPFPLFLRGCALFELKRFADAAACFDEALALEKESRMACLLGEMCRLLGKSLTATDDDVWAAYDFAYKTCLERMPLPKPEGDSLSFADAFTDPMTYDPIRVRLNQVAARIRQQRRLTILQNLVWETDPNRQTVLALMMDAKYARPTLISLSKEHPENKELQVFAFLVRYCGGSDDKLSERGPDYARDFAAAQADDPDNGCLMLIGIPIADENYKVPLNAAEIDLLRRAAHSKRFNTYRNHRNLEMQKESRAMGGECFESLYGSSARPMIMTTVHHIVERACENIAGLFDEGKGAEAQTLLSDVRLLIAKVRSEQSDSFIHALIANHMTESVDRRVVEYAARAKREDLLETALPEWEEEVRFEALMRIGATDLSAFLELPLGRMREAGALTDEPASWSAELNGCCDCTPIASGRRQSGTSYTSAWRAVRTWPPMNTRRL